MVGAAFSGDDVSAMLSGEVKPLWG
jgi:hypothetical protein